MLLSIDVFEHHIKLVLLMLRYQGPSNRQSGLSESTSPRHTTQQPRSSEDTLIGCGDSETTLVERRNMANSEQDAALERKISYGIGGAGNIRMTTPKRQNL